MNDMEPQEQYIWDQRNAITLAEQTGARRNAREIARNLLPKLTNEEIAESTGLTIKEVQALRQTP